MTLYAADQDPYEEEFDPDGPLIFVGNGGTVDTNGIAWDFMIKFSKDDS